MSGHAAARVQPTSIVEQARSRAAPRRVARRYRRRDQASSANGSCSSILVTCGPRRNRRSGALEGSLADGRRRLQPVALTKPFERRGEGLLVGHRRGDPPVAADVARGPDPRQQLRDLPLLGVSLTVSSTRSPSSINSANNLFAPTLKTGKPHGASSYVCGNDSASSRIACENDDVEYVLTCRTAFERSPFERNHVEIAELTWLT